MIASARKDAGGAGPPVVFVHGLIGHLRASAEAVTARGGVALAPDLLGYGEHAGIPASEISLPAQAAELRSCIRAAFGAGPVDLVGHSVGGAIVMLLIGEEPAAVHRAVSIEGNFTLRDAFWSASLARMSPADVAALLDGFRADPAGWLLRSGVPATAENLSIARDWLGFQPATTLRAMGHSIVEVTGAPDYLRTVRRAFASAEVCLLAGERSRPQWDTPDWALTEAWKTATLEGTGHLLMLEQPARFLDTLTKLLGHGV